MDRRRFLAATAGTLGGGAGCLRLSPTVGPRRDRRRRPTTTSPDPIEGADGWPATICENDPNPGYIPAIVDPAFDDDWEALNRIPLSASATVIGIARAGVARAYPIRVLLHHEVVNDIFDVPVLVTFCPLCNSGVTVKRRIRGRATVFGNTGFTWQPPTRAGRAAIDSGQVAGVSFDGSPREVTPTNLPNLVLFDRASGSFWSQLLARAICGPLTGTALELVPSTVTEWGTWRADHPETTVLLPAPHSITMGRRIQAPGERRRRIPTPAAREGL